VTAAAVKAAIDAALGIGKEIYDSLGYGTVEVLDAVATVVGGVVAVAILYIL
jgi:hypothetical protein